MDDPNTPVYLAWVPDILHEQLQQKANEIAGLRLENIRLKRQVKRLKEWQKDTLVWYEMDKEDDDGF